MLLKYSALENNIKKNIKPLYIIIGQDPYLFNNAAFIIKKAWCEKGECDKQILEVTNNDWGLVFKEANSYSIFADKVFLDIRFNQKNIDSKGKKSISNYLNSPNNKCLVLIKAPFLNSKQLSWLDSYKNIILVQASPYSEHELESWIKSELNKQNILYDPIIPSLIYQYSQNNMLAAAQAIEKLSLVNEDEKYFTKEMVIEHLTYQSEYSVFELTNACLAADGNKSVNILRKISQNKGEPIYILWLLSQEIRLLIQLKQLLTEKITLNSACKQLKIWPQKVKLYDLALKRFSYIQLAKILKHCALLDEIIKSNKNIFIWNMLEQLTLIFCFGWEDT